MTHKERNIVEAIDRTLSIVWNNGKPRMSRKELVDVIQSVGFAIENLLKVNDPDEKEAVK